MTLAARFATSIHEVPSVSWNALTGTDYPFLRHEFLAALEDSGSVCPETGWTPQHILVEDAASQTLVACLPLYCKQHSYGEYVFDWSWADAFERTGKSYYPKLVSCIPFTPATGPRLSVLEGWDLGPITKLVFQSIEEHAQRLKASSWHCLFPEKQASLALVQVGAAQRTGCQFHWLNRNYSSFDDYLETFTAKRRKVIRQERRRVSNQGFEFVQVSGSDVSPKGWALFHRFYQRTYLKRSGTLGYLGPDFFQRVAEKMPEQLVMVWARLDGETVAGSLYFRSGDTLYGRYWGGAKEFDCLHFEACYYQGIDYCISKGLQTFDAGAQGEHKIQRGFEPVLTYSNHWIADEGFRHAVNDFLNREHVGVVDYQKSCRAHLPFKERVPQEGDA